MLVSHPLTRPPPSPSNMPRTGTHPFAKWRGAPVVPETLDAYHFKVKLLFGLFEAYATGALAIGAVILLFAMVGAGRLWKLW